MWLHPATDCSGWCLVAATHPTLLLWWWLAHGWNINRRTCEPRAREPHDTMLWVVCGGGCGGTLLGCRSTSPAPCGCWLLVSSWNTTEAGGCWWGGVGGLLFVNYIVDASIFERRALMIGAHPLGWVLVVGVWCVFLMIICVVWRISCYGHTVDALASGADEGRGNLR